MDEDRFFHFSDRKTDVSDGLQVYLSTGCTIGLGFHIVIQYRARPNYTAEGKILSMVTGGKSSFLLEARLSDSP